jgi:small subunit ribosomal protein S16
MLKIRLTRVGKKNSPAYRVVIADQKKAVNRKFIEILGHYNPTTNPKQIVIDKEKALFWLSKGAKASDTVNNLMVDLGILPKESKIKKVFGKPTKKKDAGKEVPAETKTTETEPTPTDDQAAEQSDSTAQQDDAQTVEAPVEE